MGQDQRDLDIPAHGPGEHGNADEPRVVEPVQHPSRDLRDWEKGRW